MAMVFNGKTTFDAVVNLLDTSEECVCLITPYFDFPKKIKDAILSAKDRGVKVIIVTHTKFNKHNNITSATARYFKSKQYQELKVYDEEILFCFCDNLHTKCYFNENKCIVSSMNLLKGSSENFELSFRFDWENDSAIMSSIMREVNDILKNVTNHNFSEFNTFMKRAGV